MTEPNLDQELERLLRATRAGTEPDGNARARVRAAVAVGLASAGVAKVGVSTRVGLGAKLWLLSALAVAVLVGVALLGPSEKSSPVLTPARASSAGPPIAVAPSVEPALPPHAAPVAVAASAASAARPSSSVPRGAALPRGAAQAAEGADELGLVTSMQLALRSGNAAQALALADEHARRFPGGALAQEREGARAIAQCQLLEPRARAAVQSAFEARYPGSPYAARVKAACTR